MDLVIYDGVCMLCNRFILFVIKIDRKLIAAMLVLVALLWGPTTLMAYWGHLVQYSEWGK